MNSRKKDNVKLLLKYLPLKIQNILQNSDEKDIEDLFEIRLRADQPVVFVFGNEKRFLTQSGRLTSFSGSNSEIVSKQELKKIFEKMCNYSYYSYQENVCDGFVTLENGCRVGVYGTAIVENGKIKSVRNIKGLNIRVSSEYYGISIKLAELFKPNRINLLICGPPSSGKTTILKDLCRVLSDENNYKISIIDERFEFEDYNLGNNTDVLSGYPKVAGAMISLRTLSPDIIVFDELGTTQEAEAVVNCLNCGVNFIFTMHCNSVDELKHKRQTEIIFKSNSIDYIVFLKNKSEIKEIIKFEELKDASGFNSDNFDSVCCNGAVHSLYS